jgi:hypothetical protein
MARDDTGQKTTATKPERRHARAVDAEIRNPTPAGRQRTDKTFAHLHREGKRYDKRQGN